MKHFLLVFNIFLFSICKSQDLYQNNQFVLTGKIEGRDTGYIILRYTDYNNQWRCDTTDLQNGRFLFKGRINEPVSATIVGPSKIIDFNETNIGTVFLEPGTLRLTLRENDYTHARMKGSKTQDEFSIYRQHIDSINFKYNKLDKQLIRYKYLYKNEKTDEEKKITLREENEIIDKLAPKSKEILNWNITFISHHPNSYASPFVFYRFVRILPIDTCEILFNQLTERVKHSLLGKSITDLLRKRSQNTIGGTPFDFNATDNLGNSISLSGFLGKFILLDFWASWCGPCRAAFPNLKKVYTKYHQKGLDIITISTDKDTVAWREAIAVEKINDWYNILVNKDIDENYENVHQPIPSQILINPKGDVVWRSESNQNLEDILGILCR